MQENEEFSEEDIKSYMDTFNVSREEAIKGLKQSYKDYKSEMGEGKKPIWIKMVILILKTIF